MALTNIREFKVALERRADEAEELHAQRTKAATLHALRDVVLATRVDTGRARGNWQVGEGAPPEGHDPGAYAPVGRGVPGGRARDPVAEGATQVAAATGRDIIWLHNGVPYIGVLERLDKMVAGATESLRTWWRSRR